MLSANSFDIRSQFRIIIFKNVTDFILKKAESGYDLIIDHPSESGCKKSFWYKNRWINCFTFLWYKKTDHFKPFEEKTLR